MFLLIAVRNAIKPPKVSTPKERLARRLLFEAPLALKVIQRRFERKNHLLVRFKVPQSIVVAFGGHSDIALFDPRTFTMSLPDSGIELLSAREFGLIYDAFMARQNFGLCKICGRCPLASAA